jgi:hypothetical protein
LQQLARELEAMPPERMRSAADEILKRIAHERRRAARDPLFFDLQWRIIADLARRVVDYDAGVRGESPGVEVHAEHEFRFLLNAIDGGPGLTLMGRIDRLEVYRQAGTIVRLRVLDYKQSRSDRRWAERADPKKSEFGWTAMQLPVYLMAAIEQFRRELAAEPLLETGYLVLRGHNIEQVFPVRRELVDPDPHVRAAADNPIPERIVALARDAVAGHFDVDPRRCDEWCPYRGVCRNFRHRQG